MFDRLFRGPRLRRELADLRERIEAARKDVQEAEHEARVLWGKRWGYAHSRRRHMLEEGASPTEDSFSQVMELRRKQALIDAKEKERNLADLIAREREVCAKLGEPSLYPAGTRSDGRERSKPKTKGTAP